MGGCHHGSGGVCLQCNTDVNSCCGEDHMCDECNTMFCFECYYDFDKTCPVCSKEIITDKQLLVFVLKKYNLSRNELEQEFRLQEPVYKPKKIVIENMGRFQDQYSGDFPMLILDNLHHEGFYLTADPNTIIGDLHFRGSDFKIIHGFDPKTNLPAGVIAKVEIERNSWNYNKPTKSISDRTIYWLGSLSNYNNEEWIAIQKDLMACKKWYNEVTKNVTCYDEPYWRIQEPQKELNTITFGELYCKYISTIDTKLENVDEKVLENLDEFLENEDSFFDQEKLYTIISEDGDILLIDESNDYNKVPLVYVELIELWNTFIELETFEYTMSEVEGLWIYDFGLILLDILTKLSK